MSLAVVAAMLAYMGAFEERVRREMTRLSAWPRALPREVESLARELLDHVAGVLRGRRVAVAWEADGDPWRHLVWMSGPEVQIRREDAGGEPLVPEPLAAGFLCADTRGPAPTVLVAGPGGLQRWQGSPLARPLQARFQPTSILGLPLGGEMVSGWMFVFDRADLTSDDLVLGDIVVRQVAARLDHYYLTQRLQDHAATEERIRLARDLHDGVLQTLAGVALQMESIAALMESSPAEARHRLRETQRVIATEQGDLRMFIRRLRPQPLGAASPSLVAEAQGPRVLRERVETLGGQLLIDSTDRGTRLDIRLPLDRVPATGTH
jgi:signal transduction histidine kinase